MNCQGYQEKIEAYCEHRLGPEERRELEQHAAACARCGEFHAKAMEITCREVSELYDYIENLLSPERRAVFERHFSICPECRHYFETYRQTIRLGKAAFAERPGASEPPLPEALVRSILDERKRS